MAAFAFEHEKKAWNGEKKWEEERREGRKKKRMKR